jgi:hypothetical protein
MSSKKEKENEKGDHVKGQKRGKGRKKRTRGNRIIRRRWTKRIRRRKRKKEERKKNEKILKVHKHEII